MAFWKKNNEDDLLRDTPAGPARPIELPKVSETRVEARPEARPDAAVQPGAVRSSLGPDTSITGKLSFSAPTRIDGKLKGEIRATDLLIIGEQAVVEGAVRALKLVLHGEVQGDVIAVERVEIVTGGKLRGSVQAPIVVVHEGALLDGDCKIVPQAGKPEVKADVKPQEKTGAPATPPPAKAATRS